LKSQILISDQTRKTEPTNIYLEQFVTVSVYEKINELFYLDIWEDGTILIIITMHVNKR